MIRKIALIILLVTGMLLIAGGSLAASSGSCGDSVRYTLNDDGYLVISGTGAMADYSYQSAPWSGEYICSLKIENGVTSIGASAFSGCSILTWTDFADSVLRIERGAFSGATSLSLSKLPVNLQYIGDHAFNGCNLGEITIPNTLTAIDEQAFAGCDVTPVAYADSDAAHVLSHSGYSFRQPDTNFDIRYLYTGEEVSDIRLTKVDESVTSFEIPSYVTSIAGGAFSKCSSLNSLTIPDTVTEIFSGAFRQSITLYAGLDSTAAHALGRADYSFRPTDDDSMELKYLYVNGEQQGVELVGYFNYQATVLNVPSYVTAIGQSAFKNKSLQEIYLPAGLKTIGESAFENCASLHEIDLPEGLLEIGDSAFKGCAALQEITIPNDVVQIKGSTFSGCSSLQNIHLPEGLQSIGGSAFSDCTVLSEIQLPEGLLSLGSYAFQRCNAVESLTIPSTVTTVQAEAFANCSATRYAQLDTSGALALSRAGYSFHVSGTDWDYEVKYEFTDGEPTGLGLKSVSKDVTAFEIPQTVTSIGSSAFGGCTALTSIQVPNFVTSIGASAFYGCTSLTRVTMTNSVTSIGERAFYGCTSLTDITLSSGISTISKNMFYGCTALTEITIPQNVTQIQENAFDYCLKLSSLTLPNGLTTIGNRAFYRCHALNDIALPDSVTTLGTSAFQDCPALARVTLSANLTSIPLKAFADTGITGTITIPGSVTTVGTYAFDGAPVSAVVMKNGVETIDNFAFNNCTQLTTVTVPDTLTSIGNKAFYTCSALDEIIGLNGLTTLGTNPFPTDSYHQTYRLYADIGSTGAYTLSDLSYSFYTADSASGHYGYRYEKVYENGNYAGKALMLGLMDDFTTTSFTVPDEVTGIGKVAFMDHTQLEHVVIPETVTRICLQAFMGCTSLAEAYLPDSITDISYNTFMDCSSLQSVHLPANLTRLDMQVFQNCSSLTEIELPDYITYINRPFGGCPAIRYVNPDSQTAVTMSAEGLAFRAPGTDYDQLYLLSGGEITGVQLYDVDKNVTTFTVPDTITSIRTTFTQCLNLRSISISADHPKYSAEDGVLYNKEKTALVGFPQGRTESYTVPDTLTSLSLSMFSNANALPQIIIPATVTSLSNSYNSFNNSDWTPLLVVTSDSAARSFAIQKDLRFILPGEEDYQYTANTTSTEANAVATLNRYLGDATELILPTTLGDCPLQDIGEGAFNGSQVQRLVIPDSITFIHENAFTGAPEGMILVSGADSVARSYAAEHGIPWQHEPHVAEALPAIPATCTEDGLTEGSRCSVCGEMIAEQEPIPALGHEAVIDEAVAPTYTETGLTEGKHCSRCGAVLIVQETIPVLIADGTCGDNLNWTLNGGGQLTISGNGPMTNYSESEFAPWYSYRSEIFTVKVGNDVTSIGDYAFSQCGNLSEIDLPASLTNIGSHSFAWSGITSITIPEGVTQLSAYAFYYCSNLQEVFLPASFELKIGVFSGCDQIQNFHVAEGGTEWSTVDGVLFKTEDAPWNDHYQHILAFYPKGRTASHYTVPDGVTLIGDNVFEAERDLISVTIPASVTWIASNAFTNTSSLTHIYFEGTEEEWANMRKDPSSSVDYLATATVIYEYQSQAWSEPTYVWAEDHTYVTAVRNYNDEISETETKPTERVLITAPTETTAGSFKWINAAFQNTAFTDQEKEGTIPALNTMTVLNLPSFLTTIETEAFDGVAAEAIIVPSSVTTIEPKAFTNCRNMKYIRIPAGVAVPDDAFDGSPNVVVDQN